MSSKFPAVTSAEVINVLQKIGFRFKRQSGSSYVDDFYRCVFKQEGSIYKLYFVGTHKLIDRFK